VDTEIRTEQVVLYGADRCADCRRAKDWLTRHHVPFTAIDTDADADARERATHLAGGHTAIPVVVVPGGTVLVEPTDGELAGTLAGHRRRRATGWVRCR
jgi:glutaredoxin